MSPPNLAEALTPQRLHAELLATSASGAWSYLFGAAHDATISSRHGTVRFGQADVEWLDVLRVLIEKQGQKAWMYREGSTRRFWVLETSAKWLTKEPSFSTCEERCACARGYFDAEGGIPRDVAARFYIQFVQKDRADIARLQAILASEGIACGKLHRPSRKQIIRSGGSTLQLAPSGISCPGWGPGIQGSAVCWPLVLVAGNQDEDIVHAPWRHGEPREQGSRSGSCGWITSFLGSTTVPRS